MNAYKNLKKHLMNITALYGLGFVKASQGEFNKARKVYIELRQIEKSNINTQNEHIALHQLGMVERRAS